MKREDLHIGSIYSGKKPSKVTYDRRKVYNDRQILKLEFEGDNVMYDTPTVKTGESFPIVSTDTFLKWAGKDVTELCPDFAWRR